MIKKLKDKPEKTPAYLFNFTIHLTHMKFLFILLPVLFLFNCKPKTKATRTIGLVDPIKKVEWLIGTWQKQSAEGTLTECWLQLNDSTFSGQSFFIIRGDTVSSESIRLEKRGEKLFYIPTVEDQNDGNPVIFTQTALTDSTMTFENPKHDFPQVISYRFQKPDSLIAEVSAMIKGESKLRVFRMKKEL